MRVVSSIFSIPGIFRTRFGISSIYSQPTCPAQPNALLSVSSGLSNYRRAVCMFRYVFAAVVCA